MSDYITTSTVSTQDTLWTTASGIFERRILSSRMRGFEVVRPDAIKGELAPEEISIPKRGTANSACYDFFLNEDIVIKAGDRLTVFSNIKAYMLPDEVLMVYPRSSSGIKFGLELANTVGVVDSDYYSNSDNDGNIGFFIVNTSDKDAKFLRGDRIVQAMFQKILIADEDSFLNEKRFGGYGSTTK